MSGSYRGFLALARQDFIYFTAILGKKWFGLARRTEQWLPIFDAHCTLPADIAETLQDVRESRKGAIFDVDIQGTPGELGRYGYRGFCRREVTIHEVTVRRSSRADSRQPEG